MNFHLFWSPLEPQNGGFSLGKTRFLTKSGFDEKFDFGMVFLIILASFLVYFSIFFEIFSVSIFASILGWILDQFWRLLGSVLEAFGAIWALLAHILVNLGSLLAIKTRPWHSDRFLEASGHHFISFWEHFGFILVEIWNILVAFLVPI